MKVHGLYRSIPVPSRTIHLSGRRRVLRILFLNGLFEDGNHRTVNFTSIVQIQILSEGSVVQLQIEMTFEDRPHTYFEAKECTGVSGKESLRTCRVFCAPSFRSTRFEPAFAHPQGR